MALLIKELANLSYLHGYSPLNLCTTGVIFYLQKQTTLFFFTLIKWLCPLIPGVQKKLLTLGLKQAIKSTKVNESNEIKEHIL